MKLKNIFSLLFYSTLAWSMAASSQEASSYEAQSSFSENQKAKVSESVLDILKKDEGSNQKNGMQQTVLTKKDFFASAGKSEGWWEEWGSARYTENAPSLAGPLTAKSNVIRNILESDYGVKIPFEPGKVSYATSSRVLGKAGGGIRVSGDWCSAITPTLLSSSLAAATAYIAPEFTFPRSSNQQNVKQNAASYLKVSLDALQMYCTGNYSGVSIALKQFLDDYLKIIGPIHNDLLVQKKANEDEKLRLAKVAEENARRKQIEQEAAKKRNLELAAQFKEEHRVRMVADAQIAEEKRRAEREAQERHDSDIKAGKIPFETVKEAILFHDAKDGFSIVAKPPVESNRALYSLWGKLTRKDGPLYIFEVRLYGDTRYFAVRTSSRTKYQKDVGLRFEDNFALVGQFVNIFDYTTVGGITRVAPVFEAIMIGR